jgi:hypothetical protein
MPGLFPGNDLQVFPRLDKHLLNYPIVPFTADGCPAYRSWNTVADPALNIQGFWGLA